MKKHLFLFLIFILPLIHSSCERKDIEDDDTTTILYTSDIISIEAAKKELLQLLNDIDDQTTKSSNYSDKTISESYTYVSHKYETRSDDLTYDLDSTVFYVFNFENGQGYAVMCGNVDLPTLIALADSGTISPSQVATMDPIILPHPVKKQMYYYVYDDWENIIYKDNGYCSVTWSQRSPYNNKCPVINDTISPTGCVATATAQLMSIYKYPSSHNGYFYDWDAMTEYASAKKCSSEAQDQIATLMAELGSSGNLDADYHTTSTSIYSNKIPGTLENFGYSCGGTYSDYDIDTIVSELKEGNSVLVAGKSFKTTTNLSSTVTYSGGHCWLCHGLLERRRTVEKYSNITGIYISSSTESEWYLLCNWGWGGQDDGYFLSESFDAENGMVFNTDGSTRSTEGEKYNYQYNLKTITGIRK